MKNFNFLGLSSCVVACLCIVFAGCGKESAPTKTGTEGETAPATTTETASTHTPPSDMLGPFTIGPSEYPSWVGFKVSGRAGLVNPEEGGEHGPLEKKWGVDIVVDYTDYDTTMQNYGSGATDAACVTNGDALTLVGGKPGVAILPTSTSSGADAILAYGIDSLEGLKTSTVRGLEKSVSQFAFIRILQKEGLNPAEFKFDNMDPEAAAVALQGNTDGSGEVQAGMLWNPFVIQCQAKNSKLNLIADTTEIPEEVVDMVLVSQEALNREGGDRFAHLICDIYYSISDKLADSSTAEAMRGELGKDFANLDAQTMVTVLQQTSFYATPQDGMRLFDSVGFQDIMKKDGVVPQTYILMGSLTEDEIPSVSFDGSDAELQFSNDYMKYVKSVR